MSRIFEITDGLENLGALKTGGQGSVYKARRKANILTAVKILPTPIHSENHDDKNYIAFENEVLKLKRVNEKQNPHLVRILNHGLTSSGSLPFIEMEYIDGPDLHEMLQTPNDPVFTIKEIYKVAEQMASALRHCHSLGVKHGDIKSNNIKFDVSSGNYKLIDFGLALLSEEQRRSSVRYAGAIEFMAPEQSEGVLLFESDIYSYGIVLFELLTGVVPFVVKDNSSAARIKVMLAHKEASLPDIKELRRSNLPANWSKEQIEREMQIPPLLVNVIRKCLQKAPGHRFKNGFALWQYLNEEPVVSTVPDDNLLSRIKTLEVENSRLIAEKAKMQKLLIDQQHTFAKQQIELKPIRKKQIGLKLTLLFALVAIPAFLYLWNTEGKNTLTFDNKNKNNTTTPVENVPVEKQDKPPVTVKDRLAEARDLLKKGKVAQAIIIYKDLLDLEVPEAMFQYGHLALKGQNNDADCKNAYELIKKAGEKKFTPAISTLGFLYVYGNNKEVLTDNGYNHCDYEISLKKGTALLLEAAMKGDKEAKKDLELLASETAQFRPR